MAFQFVHLEAYSRKADKGGRSVSWVLDEAERKSGACVHVDEPEPPEVVFGVTISDLRAMHDDAVAGARTVNKDGKEKAIRVDQKTLLTVVASHPFTVEECKADASKMAEYEAWERDTIQWLGDQYGDDLKTVVRHSDESHMHIHAYALPVDLKALEMHPGVSAKRKEKAAALDRGEDGKSANKIGDAAYKDSMRAWQDSYFDSVAIKHGLARLGPKLRRLSREDWQREKAAAQSLKKAMDRAVALQWKGNKYINDVKQKAAEITGAAKAEADAAAKKKAEAVAMVKQAQVSAKKNAELNERAKKQHVEASKTLKKAQSDANRILSAARFQAEKMSGWGAGIRSFFSGFRINKIRDQVEKEKAAELAKLEHAQRVAQNSLEHERDLRRKAEKRAENSSVNVREMSVELAQANERINALSPNRSKRAGTYSPPRNI